MKAFNLSILIIAMTLVSFVIAAENKGAKEFNIEASYQGNVFFPHSKHQEKLGDCNICHVLFKKQSGIIKEMKQKGELNPKQVMKTQCIDCHKTKSKAGEAAGPTTCNACHKK
ncbi:MAG: cytochrome c3 family protein [Desulfobacterales bacterium]|nr:cytochrome c3 family protein [Desulfobacterales bacterium]